MVIFNKNGVTENNHVLFSEESLHESKKKHIFLFSHWIENKTKIKKFPFGIQINSDQALEISNKDLKNIDLVQFNFLHFKDGRPFTLIKILRKELNFKKEIRATGNILPDQIIFLFRVGFDTIQIDEKKKESCFKILEMDKGLYYQPKTNLT